MATAMKTGDDIPCSVAAFDGKWVDSFGNGVFVDGTKVTLMKWGRPKTLELYFDEWNKTWVCGNGYLGEHVYKENDGDDGKVLKLVTWASKGGHVSVWIRALDEEENVDEKVRALPESEAAVATPPVAAEDYSKTAASSDSSDPEAGASAECLSLAAFSRRGESWFDITEQEDPEEQFSAQHRPVLLCSVSRQPQHVDKLGDQAATPAPAPPTEWKKTKRGRRGGRNRSGRNREQGSLGQY